jgi:lipopolysaccharide export system protein LptC
LSDLASLAGAPPPLGETAARARRAARMAAWRKRSALILRLRRILPIMIAVIVVMLGLWVIVEGVLTRLADVRGDAAYIHMTNARFYGRDGAGRAYVLGAAEASRVNGDIQQIKLIGPILAFGAGGPGESHISARSGVYREDDRILRLSGNVVLRDPSNNVFTTDQAIVDTVHGTVIGKSNVTGQGPTGAISADNFVVYDQGKRIIFNGDVHSRFKQD